MSATHDPGLRSLDLPIAHARSDGKSQQTGEDVKKKSTSVQGVRSLRQQASQATAGKSIAGDAALNVSEAGPRWTFLTNHSHVLILLSQNSAMVLREVALRVGITERAVQRIIAELEEGGILERERIGRQNVYRINVRQPLRHPIESHRTVADLLSLARVD
jgi:hypothetical protein